MQKLNPQHILISRTDNIGDVILTLPLASLLKEHFPKTKISFLTRNYAKAAVTHCPHVDHFLSYDEIISAPEALAISKLKQLQVDCILHVFPRKEIAKLSYKAKIKHRIGTSRRWYHYLFCNQRVSFTRAKSELHEAELNLKLLSAFGIQPEIPESLADLITIEPKINLPDQLKTYFVADKFNLIIHPLSNGNGREWPLSYFIELINSLPLNFFNILITGSEHEKEKLKSLFAQCPTARDVCGKLTLDEFFLFIKNADGLIANSTGPLHMAAALGIKTLGLYPPAPGISPKRWGPIGHQAQYIVHSQMCAGDKCSNQDCACMRAIEVQHVTNLILTWIE